MEVTEGLEPGEEIVVSSQFLIDSESKLQEAVRKLLQTGSATDTQPTGPATAFGSEEPSTPHSHETKE